MNKYLRDKITGHPAVFSPADDLPFDDNISSMKKTHSKNSLNDIMSISINSNLNDITSIDQAISQVAKLTTANVGNEHRLINSSSPSIVIPKKSSRSNPSSQSSSSYTPVVDQMSSLGETSLQIHREFDDASYISLPTLSSTGQQLEHRAARDRIAVKNKRRQPIKEKVNILKENNDNQIDLFSSTTIVEDEQVIVVTSVEPKIPQPIVDLSDLDTARSRLRVPVRPRDHSADNIISSASLTPTYITSVQRSISFKRPQEIVSNRFSNSSSIKTEQNDQEEGTKIESKSSKEHIYDNLDLFKHHRLNNKSQLNSNENDSVKTHEQSMPRLRPVTMYIPTNDNDNNNNKQTINEFENVFNQLKKRVSNTKAQSEEEVQETVKLTIPSISVQETSLIVVTESEPINSVVITTEKKLEISSVSKAPDRRKTVGGVNLTPNNKIATEDNKPTPSWIDIAKQKQSKFQSISIEKSHQDETEPIIVSKRETIISSNVSIINENSSDDKRSTVVTCGPSPTNTHTVERDSIRALKAGNSNRINNLIQFFDK